MKSFLLTLLTIFLLSAPVRAEEPAKLPDKLKDIKDPFANGPFEYRPLAKGFELKSKLLFRDQPVTLTVGQTKQE